MLKLPTSACAICILIASAWPGYSDPTYFQTNLVSDGFVPAANTDPNLKDPWGVSFSAASPFWASDAASGKATLYNGLGVPNAIVVSVPGGPTGEVNNGTAGVFLVNGSNAKFIFDTLGGTVQGWNGGASATVEASKTGAVYTGLALDSVNSSPYLYAADFSEDSIDVYNSAWAPTTLGGGSFIDPNLPAGYAPYNIQNIGGNLYVEYAEVNTSTDRSQAGAGLGFVDVFSPDGTFLNRLISGGALDAPWGVTIAPAGFGAYAGDLLVGNFGNGEINAFNPTTGSYVGTIDGPNGQPLVNSGLWSLSVRTGAAFDPNAVYFTAGLNNEADGLFGQIDPVPEPGMFPVLAALLLAMPALGWWRRRRRQRSA